MLNNTLPNVEDLSCPLGHTCKKCLLYRSMPVDIIDPTTGNVLRKGEEWDCLFAWIMLGSWDSGRQTEGLHAAVNQAQNESNRRQAQVFGALAAVVTGNKKISTDPIVEALEHADNKSHKSG